MPTFELIAKPQLRPQPKQRQQRQRQTYVMGQTHKRGGLCVDCGAHHSYASVAHGQAGFSRRYVQTFRRSRRSAV